MSNDLKSANSVKTGKKFSKLREELGYSVSGIAENLFVNIDYINAHGTSTPLGDDIELNAIMKLTNENKKVKISSTKSSIGHLLGAAGSVEAILSILSINENVIPATLNLHNPSHSFNVDLVPHNPIDHKVNIALSNSFGFGGTNTALLFKSI